MIAAAIISLVVSVTALAFARRAANSAERQREISDEQRRMQRVEHDAFMAQLSARALLDCTADLTQGDDPRQRVTATRLNKTLRIGLSNHGQRPAERVYINVLVPRDVDLHWSDAHGTPLAKPQQSPEPIDEALDRDGQSVLSHYVNRREGPIDLAVGGHVFFARLGFDIPLDEHGRGQLTVPARVRVTSPDLPEGQQTLEVEKTWTFFRD